MLIASSNIYLCVLYVCSLLGIQYYGILCLCSVNTMYIGGVAMHGTITLTHYPFCILLA